MDRCAGAPLAADFTELLAVPFPAAAAFFRVGSGDGADFFGVPPRVAVAGTLSRTVGEPLLAALAEVDVRAGAIRPA